MKKSKIYNYLAQYIDALQSNGKLHFSLDQVIKEFPVHSKAALKLSLNRLSAKHRVLSVYKGFYIIIPPEYRHRKIIPPELFIDALFAYLKRPYYAGLLSAAALHGASHQQAMEYYVFIKKPALRATNVAGLKINYVVKNVIPEFGIEKRKTDAGYINVSNAELTAIDLIEYQHRIGGLNRAATVLYELSESMSPVKLKEILNNDFPLSVLQRFGYIFEFVLHKKELAKIIKSYLADKKIFRVLLKSGYKKKGIELNNDWKVFENIKIETDF
jgi:predicted transcriptional regulator of viral defense system